MSTISLVLDKLRMTNRADELDVSVHSSVSLSSVDGNVQFGESSQLIEILKSGKIWVSRGIGCRLDFTILLNGQQADQNQRERIIHDISYEIINAPLWSQISLDARVERPQYDGKDGLQPSFSIGLKHSFSSSVSTRAIGSQVSAAADVEVPTSVLRLKLQKVEICIDFSTSKVRRKEQSGVRDHPRGPQSRIVPPELLQDERGLFVGHDNLKPSHSLNFAATKNFETSTSVCIPCRLSYEDEEMLDENYLPGKDSSIISTLGRLLPVRSSLESLPLQEGFPKISDDADEITSSGFDPNSVSRMTEYALRTVIGGRQTKNQPEFKILRPLPTQTLSQIAPGLWSPGFLEAISQRARFLPTISHTLSTSCLRNAQSPALRRKLVSLAARNCEPICDADSEATPTTPDRTPNLNQIIQGRLWAMMQLSLYDPLAARRLLPTTTINLAGDSKRPATPRRDSSPTPDGAPPPPPACRLLPASDKFSFIADDDDVLFDESPNAQEDEEWEEQERFEALLSEADEWEGQSSEEFEDLLDGNDACGPRGDSVGGAYADIYMMDDCDGAPNRGAERDWESSGRKLDDGEDMQLENERMLI